jgi:hypothetical protein
MQYNSINPCQFGWFELAYHTYILDWEAVPSPPCEQQMLSGLPAPVLSRSLIIQQTLENELCIVPLWSLLQIVYISFKTTHPVVWMTNHDPRESGPVM